MHDDHDWSTTPVDWAPARVDEPRRSSVPVAVGILAAVVVIVLVAALVNGLRNRNDNVARPFVSAPAPLPTTSPSTPGPSGGPFGGFEVLPSVACPSIRDEQSHLAYTCIDNYLEQDGPDTYLGLRIALNHSVEPGWVITEGSGNPKSLAVPAPSNSVVGYRADPGAAQVSAEVHDRTERALVAAYGDEPSSRTVTAEPRTVSGASGYLMLTEIAINPAYRAARKLMAKTERLWVLGVATKAGVSIFMLSIPDSRKDLWPKAEATIATVHII
jgi:hypothetical protein